jgi:hypothetical protein
MDQLENDPAIFIAAVQGAVAMARALAQEAREVKPDPTGEVPEDWMPRGEIAHAEDLMAKLGAVLSQAEWAGGLLDEISAPAPDLDLAEAAIREVRRYCRTAHRAVLPVLFAELGT